MTFKTLLSIINHFATIFLMEQSESSRKEPRITFPPMKASIIHVEEERGKVSKNSHNLDLINLISAAINGCD